MTPATRGFHHIALVTGDAARTIRFYRDQLGLSVLHQSGRTADRDSQDLCFSAGVGGPGRLITFLPSDEPRRGRWGVGGIHHLALGCADQDAQLKWKRWLTDHGVAVSGPYDRGWFHSIYFTDPDGQVLEIATAGPGYDVDEPTDQLGTTVQMPGEAQLRGFRDEAAIAARTYPEPVAEISDDMRLDGIHHVTGMTNDVHAMSEFYQASLGLRLVKRSVNQDDPATPHWFWANYDGAHVGAHSSLTMFGWPTSNYRARPGAGQTHHIAFRADDVGQLHAWREHLLAFDAGVTEVIEREGYASIFFHAPDGLLMEMASDT